MAEIGLLLLGTFGVFVFGYLKSNNDNFWSVVFLLLGIVAAILMITGFIASAIMLVGAL